MKNNKVVVAFEEGLHARPATKFVQLAKEYKSEIKVFLQDKSANAKSILEILMLGVMKNAEIIIQADGPDEESAVTKLSAFVQDIN